MTHSGGQPHNLGDQGQRFEITVSDNDTGRRSVFGWADRRYKAAEIAAAIEKTHCWTDARIRDRRDPETPYSDL